MGPLVAKCRTLDQARAVVTFLDAASEKTLRSTVALTATRGRGKVRHPIPFGCNGPDVTDPSGITEVRNVQQPPQRQP